MIQQIKRWVRRASTAAATSAAASVPEYDLETVQRALRAAVDMGRYDLAQQIVKEASSDLCVVCARSWAEGIATTSNGDEIQVCSTCAEWSIP